MHTADFISLLPLEVLAAASLAVMLAAAIRRSHTVALAVTLAGLGVAFACLWPAGARGGATIMDLLAVDPYALFYEGLIIAAAFAVAAMSHGYLERHQDQPEEFYILLLLATLGASVLASGTHFVSFFLGLEVLSVSLYGLIAYPRTRHLPVEAGIKYLVLAAASAAFLLFGMALIYAEAGTMEFTAILTRSLDGARTGFLYSGMALIATGIGFKLAVVPFHLWTPDVYEGAPAPVTAFVATVSKGGMFALLVRYYRDSGGERHPSVLVMFAIIAVASMIAGNVLALLQTNVKRILAYSSIAHLGYLLVAFLAAGDLGVEAVTFYLVAYFITTLGAFGVITALSAPGRDADRIEDYRGLFWRRPVLAAIFTAMLFSLAGIPLTAGFIGKFYIVAAGASTGLWALIIILVVTSAIGLFYYLRIIVALYVDAPEGAPAIAGALPVGALAVLCVLTIALLWLGVYPTSLLYTIRAAAAAMI